MDYRVLAQEELRALPMLHTASINTEQQLDEVTAQLKKAAKQNAEQMFVLKEERSELNARLRQTRLRMARIIRAFDVLGKEERQVLTETYIEDGNTPEDVMYNVGVEKSTYYRIRNAALEKFTRAMYGVVIS